MHRCRSGSDEDETCPVMWTRATGLALTQGSEGPQALCSPSGLRRRRWRWRRDGFAATRRCYPGWARSLQRDPSCSRRLDLSSPSPGLGRDLWPGRAVDVRKSSAPRRATPSVPRVGPCRRCVADSGTRMAEHEQRARGSTRPCPDLQRKVMESRRRCEWYILCYRGSKRIASHLSRFV